jgi:hypothetical protein
MPYRFWGLLDSCLAAEDTLYSMFKFLNFLHSDAYKIIQQLGTVAKPSVLCGLNLSQPYACRKALTEKHRQQVQPIL